MEEKVGVILRKRDIKMLKYGQKLRVVVKNKVLLIPVLMAN